MDATPYQYAKLEALRGIKMHLHNIDMSLRAKAVSTFTPYETDPTPNPSPFADLVRKIETRPDGTTWICQAVGPTGASQWKKIEMDGYSSF
jgi:hypothetical protein